MDVNFTRLQEFLPDLNTIYNLSFALSIISCPNFGSQVEGASEEYTTETTFAEEENGIFVNAWQTIGGLFYYPHEKDDTVTTDSDRIRHQDVTECISIFTYNGNERLSTAFIFFVLFLSSSFLIWIILSFFRCLYKKVVSKKLKDQKEMNDGKIVTEEMEHVVSRCEMSEEIGNSSSPNEKLNTPVRITCITRQQNLKNGPSERAEERMDAIFDSTLSLFSKQLDTYFGFEIKQLICQYTSFPSTIPVSSDVSMQSPRVRRKWSRPQDINPSLLLKNHHTNENNMRGWMMFEMFCKRMNWVHSKYLFENIYIKKDAEKMKADNSFQEYFHQNCVSNVLEWKVSVAIVNYTLYLLDQMLNNLANVDKSNGVFRLAKFVSVGSAANGTLLGKPDYFDVMFVLDFKATDLVLLHNNHCDEIPPGHVVISVKDVDSKNGLQENNCLHKCQVKDTFGFYLKCNQVEKIVNGMIHKAVKKLNIDYQHRMERLPFKLKASFTDDLVLNIDTSLLSKFGFGISNILIKFIPSICIECSEFALLPKLYAVPSWRVDHRNSWEEKGKRVGALTKLFPKITGPRLSTTLFWNLSVSELEGKVKENIQENFHSSQSYSCHENCLMVLKSLFSANKRTLLNGGEISSYVLSTVVNFLLIESSATAWEMSQLPDRISDAIHFLISSYTNVWLPNLVIHNPHLSNKIPVLDKLSPLLTGRQQNLLADVDAKSASKALSFIESRLKQTGLSKALKPEYSEEMWEYEFFLFG